MLYMIAVQCNGKDRFKKSEEEYRFAMRQNANSATTQDHKTLSLLIPRLGLGSGSGLFW
jgi:hypothetical protein